MSLDLSLPLKIAPHADLKTRTEGDILVLPEQAIRLGGSGSEILRLVISLGSGAAAMTEMRRRYPEAEDLETEVLGFLEHMLAIGGIVSSINKQQATQT